MTKQRKIDHIVYCVPKLEEAMDELETLMGIRPVFGGFHTTKGTKNALLNLGDRCYLEILAADHDNHKVQAPRWMGIDQVDRPQITRWAIKSSELMEDSATLKAYDPEMGVIQGGQRQTGNGDLLKWEMILPLANPLAELIPFMTDWQNSSVHPTDQLPNQCQLSELFFTAPNPSTLQDVFDQLRIHYRIKAGPAIQIKATIKCPAGFVEI